MAVRQVQDAVLGLRIVMLSIFAARSLRPHGAQLGSSGNSPLGFSPGNNSVAWVNPCPSQCLSVWTDTEIDASCHIAGINDPLVSTEQAATRRASYVVLEPMFGDR